MRALPKVFLFGLIVVALSHAGAQDKPSAREPNALDNLIKATNSIMQGASRGPTAQDQDKNAFYLYRDTKEAKDFEALRGLGDQPGHWIAANFVGCIYSQGLGLQPDPIKAYTYFEKSAPYYPLAAYNLGIALSNQNKSDKAKLYFQFAWDVGGYEQAGAWLISMKFKRKEDISELIRELDLLESPIGRYYLGRTLMSQGKYKDAVEKLATASDYGVLGSNALLASIYLQGYNQGASKFFDLVTGFSHLYVEEGIANGAWKLPAIRDLTLAGVDQDWFGNVSNNLPSINSEAYGRAGQWFIAHGKNPQRYKISLCEPDRKAKRKVQY